MTSQDDQLAGPGPSGDKQWQQLDRSRRLSQRLWRRLRIRLIKLDLARARLLHDQPSIVDNLVDLGRFSGQDLEVEAAEKSYGEARERAVDKRYEVGIARAGIGLAATAFSRKDFSGAVELYEAELPRLRLLPDKSLLAFALVSLGEANIECDRPERGESAFQEAEQIARRIGNWRELARSQYRLGQTAYFKGHYQDAYAHWAESLSIYKRKRQHADCGLLEHWLSGAAGRLGHLGEARELAVRSLASLERAGWTDAAQNARIYLMDIDEYIVEQGQPELGDC